VTQSNLLLVENVNDAAADFSKLVWVFFNLCQCTVVLKVASSLMVHV
jgi:hypothetical protein